MNFFGRTYNRIGLLISCFARTRCRPNEGELGPASRVATTGEDVLWL